MNKEAAVKTGVEGRRSERVLLKIPIKVLGVDAEGKPFSEKTFTLVINRHGARIAVRNPLRPNDRITVTNLYNNLTCPFRVVVRTGKSLGEGPEWGVECLEPDANIWGIYFPQKKVAPGEEEPIDALLECSQCSSRELAQLGRAQYQTLTTQASVRRECPKCKTTTAWRFSFVDEAWEEAPASEELAGVAPPAAAPPAPVDAALPPAPPPAPAARPTPVAPPAPAVAPPPAATPAPKAAPLPAAPVAPVSVPPPAPAPVSEVASPPAPAVSPVPVPTKREERRRVKRVTLKLPVRVRLEDGRQDITRTENYSRLGACVISSLDLKEDDRVLLTVGYTGGSSDLETPARVVWLKALGGTKMKIYGMEFNPGR